MKESPPITLSNMGRLLKNQASPDGHVLFVFFLIGVILTPLALPGALWGYIRAYNRFFRNEKPNRFPAITIVSMILFSFVSMLILIVTALMLNSTYGIFFDHETLRSVGFYLIAFNAVASFLVVLLFSKWHAKVSNIAAEAGRYFDNTIATQKDLVDYQPKNVEVKMENGIPKGIAQQENPVRGLYIGGGLWYSRQGHVITIAAPRSGKWVSLISYNLLNAFYDGSWLVVDVKGEMAYVTAEFQMSIGRRVVIIDPWGNYPNSRSRFNPLDIMKDSKEIEDDASMMASQIVPYDPNERDKYFSERARSIIAGVLVNIMLHDENKTLARLWEVFRLPADQFAEYLALMASSYNAMVRATANEISTLAKSQHAYGTIMSNVAQHTDFLKSPQLQASMASSDFNINDITDGNTTIYVIWPADKLESQYRWMRLVIASAMKAVIRNTNKRVTFIMDEFGSLGKMDEVASGLSLLSSYNLTLWPILHNIGQLQDLYKGGWHSFMGSTAIRQFFSVRDNESAKYVAERMGTRSHHTYKSDTGETLSHTQTYLMSPTQIQQNANNMILFVDDKPPHVTPLTYYYNNPDLRAMAGPNPHYKGDYNKFTRFKGSNAYFRKDRPEDFPRFYGQTPKEK